MKQWCLVVIILLLGNFPTVPTEPRLLVGSMVGCYEVGIIECRDPQSPNVVNLSLSVWVVGVNSNSTYYSFGVTEKLATVKCESPELDHEESQHLDRILMYNSRVGEGKENEDKDSKWNIYPITQDMVFTITLRSRDTQVDISFETETVMNLSTNSSECSMVVNESVSFNYRVQTNYVGTLNPVVLTAGAYISGVGITVVIIALAARKILPEEP